MKVVFFLLLAGFIGYAVWANFPLPERSLIVSDNYNQLRKNFYEAAEGYDGELSSYVLNSKGPKGEKLTIDTLWIGPKDAKRVLLHISGTHGVEGYAGSAIQTALLKENLLPPEGSAIVFIHGLNPWGMAYKRRFNESNVDLNRNFLVDESKYNGAPDAYRKVEWFLNPSHLPSKMDLFFPQVVYLIARYGFTTLKQAIAGGQYEYPKGIYFGGSKMEASNRFLENWVLEHLSHVKELYVVEVHTGLGESGVDLLFWPYGKDDPKTINLEHRLGESLDSDDPEEGAGFKTPGDLQNEVPKLIPDTDVFWILQEFGAYGPVATLRSLRNENAYYQFSKDHDTQHWTKQELVEAFSPGNREWQEKVVRRGKEIGTKFIALLKEQ